MSGGSLRRNVTIAGLLNTVAALLCLCTLTAFLGQFGWLFDLTSHFRVQYAALLLALATACFARKKTKPASFYLAFAFVNIATVAACLLGSQPKVAAGGTRLRFMLLNVHTANEQFDRVKSLIAATQPDLFVLEEVDERWLKELAALRDRWPYQISQPRDDNFGIALFSKLPLRDAEVIYLGEAEVPSITARVEVGGKVVTILGTHPLPPGGSEYARLRNGQLAAIPGFLAPRGGPAVVLGDLNVTPWNHYFRGLLRETGLRDSSRGQGLHATWPSHLWPLRIPVDHCLVSREFRVLRKQVGPRVGSDHLPLIVELAVAPNE